MSPRSIRRAAERKVQKLQRKQERLAGIHLPSPHLPHASQLALEDEFSPELIAQARAMRERIAARVATNTQLTPPAASQPSSPPSPTRAEINRANAQNSTGPVTSAGKLASSRNSLKHGLASGQLIIPGEDPAEFEALFANLVHDFQPANSSEELLVRQMAQSHWIEQRAIRLQNDCFTPDGLNEKQLALFLRYQTTHQRAFYKALHELTCLQKERRRLDEAAVLSEPKTKQMVRGFVSQNSPTPLPNSPSEPCNSHFAHPPDNEVQGVNECLNRSAAKR